MYAELSGTLNEPGSIQTGLAIANPSAAQVQVTMELTNLSGTAAGSSATIAIPPNGQVATFLNQIAGFDLLGSPFQGILRITTSSASGVTVSGLRGRYNEDGEFLIASTPPVDETAPQPQSEILFPHWAEGGGYTTQFILFNASSASSSGSFRLVSSSGFPVDLGLR